ncbi:translation initiation factor 2 [Symbioplanes lichenis]|uniref:translation initiation factor 2 n=1 Tax=Symbioplanes lichenis TaxID=1629072 RepID=UPI00273928DB|nr:translation initiation factor 2 [Actinoplanes lichenis]
MAHPNPADEPAGAHAPDVFGPLPEGERSLWRGRSAVAEYAFDQAASLPRWTLPETTEVLVTNHRIVYAHTSDDFEVRSSEMSWVFPQHIRVQPARTEDGRTAAVAQLQLVCGGSDGSFPALVFAGGDLTETSDADKLANVVRHAIARYRVDNAGKLGISVEDARELVKNLIGPEFAGTDGGEGQTVSLLGALAVPRQAQADPGPVSAPPSSDAASALDGPPVHGASSALDAPPVLEGEILDPLPDSAVGTAAVRAPYSAAVQARALRDAAGEVATYDAHPDLAARAANVAARLADLVDAHDDDGLAEPEDRGPELTARAERVRRATARFNANSARGKATVRRPDREPDPTRPHGI